MISRTHRFRGHGSVQKVRSKPARGPGFSVYAQQTQRPWRAAVVVSKKIHKSAVVRNRIRRRIYEIVRLYDKEFSLQSVDIVFIIHDNSIAATEHESLKQAVYKCIDSALKQAQNPRTRS